MCKDTHVGELLGIDTNVQVGSGNTISVMNYFKRIRVLTLNKPDKGNKVFTIVLAEINEDYDSKYYSFELYATPKNGANTLPGYAHVEFITNSQSNKFSYISCGSIDNIRLVNIDNKEKLVADINVPQYGGSDVFLTGLHNYINVIEDVSSLIG